MIRWAVWGTGAMASAFTEALAPSPEHTIAAVGSRTIEGARAFASGHGVPRWCAGLDDLVATAPDCVYVATPQHRHRDDAARCLEAGVPVLCEKPFTASAAEAADVVRTARRHGVFVMEAMWMAFCPGFLDLARTLREGRIGRLVSVDAELSVDVVDRPGHRLLDPRRAGGALLDMGCYLMWLAVTVLDGPDVVSARMSGFCPGVDRVSEFELRDRSGVGFTGRTTLDREHVHAVFQGERGRVEVEDFSAGEPFRVIAGLRADEVGTEPADGLLREAAAVGRCLRVGALDCASVPHAGSIRVMELLDAVRRAAT